MNNDRLRIQINDYDTYQYPPLALDALRDRVTQVPIIRIFGSLQLPQLCYNVLIHVHNYYPYVFLDCFEKDPELLHSSSHLDSLVGLFESKIAESFSKSPAAQTDQDHFLDGAPSKRKFIADVQVCKASPAPHTSPIKASKLDSLLKISFNSDFSDELQVEDIHLPVEDIHLQDEELHLPVRENEEIEEIEQLPSRREILSQSIELIENANYGAKVIYGDTDSLFVYLPGKSKAESFKIGDSLARLITKEFPDPIKLKFEKVYHPCVLLAKKRVSKLFEEMESRHN
ncbi:hypothetical protein QCA50_015871 [Cerrena zonata]|uniref:DNA-directed DNA polymerase n=1 Tax=Cerrena zonata TaxID=2478898 RepID=A0AAW0FPS0_9APHY